MPQYPPMPIPYSARRIDKRQVARGKRRQRGNDGEVEDAKNQRTAAPEAVSQGAQNQRTHRPHGQRDSDGEYDVALADMEIFGQHIDQKNQHEEIKGVEYPA